MKDSLDDELENKSDFSISLESFVWVIVIIFVSFVAGLVQGSSVSLLSDFSNLTLADFYLSIIALSAIFLVFHFIRCNKTFKKLFRWIQRTY